ncbi:butyrophilin-like protein 2 [Oreochromis aureus]|uniref:Ig-like domain-containing protein n=1 Tax=Oreochromis aureus TaxID=47969 RepID=A0AAZ1X8I9_OREAU|nr:butyrophilin-like protein 2 [Oreochromis aureus]XP_039466412.1 butyrophilin-like protein 2 [Oreochromis aureus]
MALCLICGRFTLRLSTFINAVLSLTLLVCRGYSQEAPTKQIVALLGDDVVLPCSLERPVDVSDLQLEWARTDLIPGFIYVWEKNKENVGMKQPSYVGRTSLSSDKLKHGDVSLTLSKVQLSDEGLYRCFIPQLGQRSYVHLIVGSASTPIIKVMSNDSSRVVLQCESAGWYPEPELLWLDGEGNLLSAGPTETLRGPDDLYTVSSRVTVEKRHSNNITCRVQQRNTNQSRETHIHVPGKSHLVCPSQVVAMMGDDVVLPCQLKLAVDTNAETVNWTKPGLDPNVVHLHKDGRLVFENQHPSYHFRTRVFEDELIKGNVSLKIFKVKLSDEGTYRCSIPWIREEASIVLTVGSASTPVIKVMSVVSSRVVLQCESAGWYPEPELLWLDGEGNLLSAGPTETLRGPDDLYTVSSRVTVEKRHSNNITCRVQQRNTNQSRETHKHVPGSAVRKEPSATFIIVIVCLLWICTVVTVIRNFIPSKKPDPKETETEKKTTKQKRTRAPADNTETIAIKAEPPSEQLEDNTSAAEEIKEGEKEKKQKKQKKQKYRISGSNKKAKT